MKTFCTYEDWTLEENPRCFYVGKGDEDRLVKVKRSDQHSVIVQQFGHKRIVILTTFDEDVALELERILIKERHTHPLDPEYNGIGCNKTLGGQGNSGRIVSDETRQRISDAKKGKTPNKIWTQAERDATSVRMSILHKGKSISKEHRDVLKTRMADSQIKAAMTEKVAQKLNEKYQRDPVFVQRICETRVRGEKHAKARFTEIDVKAMRQEWDQLDHSIRGTTADLCRRWSQEKNTSPESVYAIVTRKTWKHVI